jgi:serine/threonine protein kinase
MSHIRENRHVAIKILSAYASRKVDAGHLRELDILRTITTAAPSHQGFHHVIHLLHEFTFESFHGSHICFVTDVLSFSVPNLQKELPDSRLPLKFILRLVKHVLKALEYLHDTCEIVHSGTSNQLQEFTNLQQYTSARLEAFQHPPLAVRCQLNCNARACRISVLIV